MQAATNSCALTKADPNWCDPRQHSRDEHAFVVMLVVCVVVWLAWRLYRRLGRHDAIPRLPRRRPPGAPP